MDIDSLEATTLRHRTSEPVLTVIVKCQGEIQAMQNEIHSLEEKVNEQNQEIVQSLPMFGLVTRLIVSPAFLCRVFNV